METKRCGPSGGTSGTSFADEILLQDDRLIEVRIHVREGVCGIQIVHQTIDEGRHLFPLHGQQAEVCETLLLDADEYIVKIGGRYSEHVNSICIQTNKRLLPQWGGPVGVAYVYAALPGAEIVGFCGRAGSRLNALGVVLRRRGL